MTSPWKYTLSLYPSHLEPKIQPVSNWKCITLEVSDLWLTPKVCSMSDISIVKEFAMPKNREIHI